MRPLGVYGRLEWSRKLFYCYLFARLRRLCRAAKIHHLYTIKRSFKTELENNRTYQTVP